MVTWAASRSVWSASGRRVGRGCGGSHGLRASDDGHRVRGAVVIIGDDYLSRIANSDGKGPREFPVIVAGLAVIVTEGAIACQSLTERDPVPHEVMANGGDEPYTDERSEVRKAQG